MQVRYKLSGNELLVTFTATSDADTVWNPINHTFFNFSGKIDTVYETELKIHADAYTPIDANLIPTGELRKVRGTAFDFTAYKQIILDELRFNDLQTYRNMLDTLPNRELICGFISGKDELLNWEVGDLVQFCYDTAPIVGTLDLLLEKIDSQAVKRAIKIGACNIYHACAHNYVHEKSEDILRSLYKSAVFVLQAIWFYETGNYIKTHAELSNAINPPSAVLTAAQKLKNGASVEFEQMSKLLLDWSKTVIVGYTE